MFFHCVVFYATALLCKKSDDVDLTVAFHDRLQSGTVIKIFILSNENALKTV
jgi:hypothetical protein